MMAYELQYTVSTVTLIDKSTEDEDLLKLGTKDCKKIDCNEQFNKHHGKGNSKSTHQESQT